jgi:serine/threonine protein phosphatase PrpC
MRAIGISKQLGTLYRAEVTLAPGDRVVLATDGVMDLVPQPELVEIIRAAASPDVAVEQLHRLLVTRHAAAALGSQGRRDDWTAIVRFFSS